MKSDPLLVPDFLRHILEATARIQAYTVDMQESDFMASSLVQDAVIRNIEILGEASRNIEIQDPQFSAKYPQIPIRRVYLMRNQLTHGYSAVNLQLVWKTVQQDVPALRAVVQQVYDSLSE